MTAGRALPQAPGRRADIFLVEAGLAASRSEARAAIASGNVVADGVKVVKPSELLRPGTRIDYKPAHGYVSRGALKLTAALDHFALSPKDLVCVDIGASTGGFTEVLLERGAARVIAVDVGHGQLHRRVAADPRVVNLEHVNARELALAHVPEAPDAITVDVSFISLTLALPSALAMAARGAWLVALIKPQFEAGRAALGKGGIVRNAARRQQTCERVRSWLEAEAGWSVLGVTESPIAGGDGNREYLIAALKP